MPKIYFIQNYIYNTRIVWLYIAVINLLSMDVLSNFLLSTLDFFDQ